VDYKVGEEVEVKYLGMGEWTHSHVRSINKDGTIHVQYPDGEEEFCVSPQKIRRENKSPVNQAIEKQSSSPRPAAYKLEDKVMALYYSGTTWYKGTIKAVHHNILTGYQYDVLYDDGERENKIAEDKIKHQPAEVNETNHQTASASAMTFTTNIAVVKETEEQRLSRRLSLMADVLKPIADDEIIEEEPAPAAQKLRIGGAVFEKDDSDTEHSPRDSDKSKGKNILSGYLNELSEDLSLSEHHGLDPYVDIMSPTAGQKKKKQEVGLKSEESYRDDFDA
jgi:hypothetical protein